MARRASPRTAPTSMSPTGRTAARQAKGVRSLVHRRGRLAGHRERPVRLTPRARHGRHLHVRGRLGERSRIVKRAAAQPTPTPRSTPTPRPTTVQPSAVPTATPSASSCPVLETYVVVAGDTLSRIAQEHHLTVEELLAANPQITDLTRSLSATSSRSRRSISGPSGDRGARPRTSTTAAKPSAGPTPRRTTTRMPSSGRTAP